MQGASIAIGALTLVLVVALIAFTTFMHRSNSALGQALESVRLANSASADLLLHSAARSPLVRASLEGDLRGRLAALEPHTATDVERRLLGDAVESVRLYLGAAAPLAGLPGASEQLPERHQAFQAVEQLVVVNLAQARHLQQQSATWDRSANIGAVVLGLAVLALLAALTWWVSGRSLQPLVELAEAMERFGRGDSDARAPVTGTEELREMSQRFNSMATALGHQRRREAAFLAAVAHDLRTPLGALRLGVETMRLDQAQHQRHPPTPTVDLVVRQVNRLDRMLADLMDRTRIESGQVDLKLKACDARAIAAEVVDLFTTSGERHLLRLSVPAEAVPLECDAQRLEQVLSNLLSNAIKYDPADSPIDVTVEAKAEQVVFAVRDRGVGIGEDDLPHLFEPFHRLGPRRDDVPGTGLGLFGARRIVQAHAGDITVSSQPGRGSVFEVHVPMHPPAGEDRALSENTAIG